MERTQITNCDWLSFSVLMELDEEERATQPRMVQPPGFILQEYPGTNMYKHRAILYTEDGNKVLTLLWTPHSRIIKSNSLFVEVANPLLYDGRYKATRDILQAIHPHRWQSLSRLDICTDFQPTQPQAQIIDMLQSGAIYVQGKQEGTMWHTFSAASKYVNRTPHQLTWGGKQSQIKWKLYNKTKEIYEHTPDGRSWCNKPYIADVWQRNGLDPQQDTWRVEVSITGTSQLEWRGHRLGWDTVTDTLTLERLYYDLYATRMKMRLNQGHTYKRYDREVEFLAIPPAEVCRIRQAPAEHSSTCVAYAPTLRAIVQQLERPEVSINAQVHEPLLATLRHITIEQGLRGYFAAMTGRDIDGWIADYLEKNKGQPSEAAPSQHTEE